MEIDDQNPASTAAESPETLPGGENEELDNPAEPTQPAATSVIPPSIVPAIAPIPPPIIRPLAPLPSRPPLFRPPVTQNGELRTSDSDSEHDELAPARTAPGSTAEYEISEESRQARERHEKAMQEFLMKRRASALAVPTNDMAVRARLRRLGEPITLFGEREMERRDRLRSIMARLDAEGQLEKLMKVHEEEEAAATGGTEEAEEEVLQYPFYTEGSKALLDARIDIAKYSILRASSRLERAKRKRDDPDEDVEAEMDWALRQAESLVLDCSEIGDDRPLSGCSFSSDGKFLATRQVFSFCSFSFSISTPVSPICRRGKRKCNRSFW
ncbi:hypothetical protein IC582_024655 [Cucumis melo]